MHVLGTGVPRRLGVARSASSPKAAQASGCSLTPGLQISFGRVTCMARAASVPGLWTLGFLLFCGLCVFVRVVIGPGFQLRPGTPDWGVRVCVCSCARSACTPPLLAGVCGVVVCAWARVSAAPRHSWLGCWVCVCSCARSACTPPLLAGMCDVGVCLGSGLSCALPLLAGVLGCVCVGVPTSLVPRHSWLGCVALVCVLGLGFWLRPATPDWGVGVCVCLCARFAFSPPLLAGVCGVCVCVLWLGFRLRLATPGWGVGVCVCLCAHSACTPPLLAGVCGVGVCAWAWISAAPRHS